MQLRYAVALLVFATTICNSLAQPAGFGLPPAGVSGFARGKADDVHRVGALLNERARAKFRAPRVSDAVVDREFILTFRQDTSPATVTAVARSLHNGNTNVQLKYVGNYPRGWKGVVFKVPRSAPEETAALLESLLLIPDVVVGEANMIVTKKVRPARIHAEAPAAPPADKPKPPTRPPSEPVAPAPAPPTPPPQAPAPAPCKVLNNTDKTTTTHQTTPPNWGLDRVDTRGHNLTQDYEYASGGEGANVFVVDTGVQFDHPEIAGRAFGVGAGGFDAFGGDATDGHGHGTHCSGIVGGKSTGIAKGATIYSVRVLDEQGSGTISTLVDGMNFVANSNLTRRIASMSLGGGFAEALNSAVDAAVKAGVLVIVAAGNEDMDACDTSPASAASAVTVGAFDSEDARASFSNYGRCVDIWAPGVAIYSSTIPNTYATWSGTSMATPHVAGVAARLWSKGVCTTNVECAEALRCLATTGLVTGLDAASPNLMLYVPPGV